MFGFTGKVAVVTGAAQGIGAAIALRLAAEGADLVLTDIRLEGLEATAMAAAAKGVRTVLVGGDIADSTTARAVLEQAKSAFGRVDQLVNVAGICTNNYLADVTESEWDKVLNINLKGSFVMARAIGLQMAESGRGGRIVNIASIGGKVGYDLIMPYAASKAGLINLTQSLAKALGPAGVNVNAICPGFLWTALSQATTSWRAEHDPNYKDQHARAIHDNRVQSTALGQETLPEDVAAVAAFLLSDQARTITGQSINVDGGAVFH